MIFSWKRYLVVYLITVAALIAISLLCAFVLGFDIANSSMGFIPAFVAAMDAGQTYAKSTRDPIKDIWTQAVYMTLIVLAINVVLTTAYVMVDPEFRDMMTGAFMMIMLIVLALLLPLVLLLNRFFFGMGANQTWKAQDKAAAK